MLLFISWALRAEQGVLVLHIKDLHDHPIENLRLRAGDTSISAPTASGEARIRLGRQTKPGDVVLLEIVGFPKDKDLVFISPWDKWIHVPPFDNEGKNFIAVTLAERGDRTCLENSACIRAAAAQINKEKSPKTAGEVQGQSKDALLAVAKQFGLMPNEIDQAIRAWGQRTEDLYDKGLAALYEKRYPDATLALEKSLSTRRKAEIDARAKTGDAAFFLGLSLYEQGHYRKSAEAYEEVRSRYPDDATVLNNLALSWCLAGDYGKAEPLFRRALAINENLCGRNHPNVATELNNLAEVLLAKSDYVDAESLYERALAIDEKAQERGNPNVARDLNNWATLLQIKGDYAQAEQLYRRVLAMGEKALGPNHPYFATALENLAASMQARGDYGHAEPLFEQALTMHKKALGPNHPEVATDLNNLGELFRAKGDYSQAEPLYLQALAIDEKALGHDHRNVARDLNNHALLLQAKGDYGSAEPLYRRSLSIRQKALGLKHPDVAKALNNLALLFQAKGDYGQAESLFRQALAIDEKTLGSNHPTTNTIRHNLKTLSRITPQKHLS